MIIDNGGGGESDQGVDSGMVLETILTMPLRFLVMPAAYDNEEDLGIDWDENHNLVLVVLDSSGEKAAEEDPVAMLSSLTSLSSSCSILSRLVINRVIAT
jgi:hypothetical protein